MKVEKTLKAPAQCVCDCGKRLGYRRCKRRATAGVYCGQHRMMVDAANASWRHYFKDKGVVPSLVRS